MSTSNNNRLRGSVAVASLLVTVGPSLADAASGSAGPPAPPPFELRAPTILRHLPAGREELVFRGESTRRRFPVYLNRDEADATRLFQLAYSNTVTALPERSVLQVAVNGQALASIPLAATNAPATIPVAVPAGVLRAGLNTVEFHAVMAHRVDCSVPATYELWASLDPAATGFAVPAAARVSVRSVEDLAGEPLADDGTTHLRLRTATGIDGAAVGRAATFITALTARAGFARPVVEIGSTAGSGPGLDVVLGTDGTRDRALAGLRIVGRADGLLFARDPASQRLTVALTGSDEADLDARLATFAGQAPRAAAGPGPDVRLDGEARKTFADFGLSSETFSGRHHTATLALELPADFYPADYAKARLLIHGARANGLDPDSGLAVRVNDVPAGLLPFPSGRGGEFRNEPVELPLRLFHPGHNEIAVDATAMTPGDRACDVLRTPNDPRFSLFDDSELVFPRFAHLGVLPEIAGALTGSRARPVGPLYIADTRDASVAAALTVLANMSTRAGRAGIPAIHLGAPAPTDAPGLVVGSWDALPAALTGPLAARLAGPDLPRAPVAPTGDAGAAGPARSAAERLAALVAAGRTEAGRWIDLAALRDGALRLLRQQGFAFGRDERDGAVPFTPRSLLVAAVEPRLASGAAAGIELPRFVEDQGQWLVVTASDTSVLGRGLDRLVSDGRWSALQGEAVSLDADNGALVSAQPARVLYVLPRRLTASEVAPILSGMVSANIGLGLAALVALIVLLGLSTHVVIRKSGVR